MRLQSSLICFTGCFMAARVAMDVYFESNLIVREVGPPPVPFVPNARGYDDGAAAAPVVFQNETSGYSMVAHERDRPTVRSLPTELMSGNSPHFLAARTEGKTSQFAYAFVIGGCNPDNGRYMGFLYNVMVAAKVLRDEGSQSDVVLLLQISPNSTASTLPPPQQHAIEALGIYMYYIPKARRESFYDTVLNKFRVLQLVQYKKVMLLDADVLPLGNLDYMFTLNIVRPNVIVSGALEPANGGVFVVSPGPHEHRQLQSIIERRRERSGSSSAFDPVWGWGHEIRLPDEWVARRPGVRGTNWTFHFAFSDQGLLYHWTKYVKQNVSIVFEDRVENWGPGEAGSVVLQETIQKPFEKHSKPRLRVYAMCHKFLCDIMHFSGTKKPWLPRPPRDISEATRHKDAFHFWWYTLRQIDATVGLNIDYDHWRTWQEQPLGNYAVMPQ